MRGFVLLLSLPFALSFAITENDLVTDTLVSGCKDRSDNPDACTCACEDGFELFPLTGLDVIEGALASAGIAANMDDTVVYACSSRMFLGHGEEYGPVGYGDPSDSSSPECVTEKIE